MPWSFILKFWFYHLLLRYTISMAFLTLKSFKNIFLSLTMFNTVLAQQHLSKFPSHSTLCSTRIYSNLQIYVPRICEEPFFIYPHLHAFFYWHIHHVLSRTIEQNEKRFWDILRLSVRMTTFLSQLVCTVEKCFLDMQPAILQCTAKKGSSSAVKGESRVRVSDGCASRWHW